MNLRSTKIWSAFFASFLLTLSACASSDATYSSSTNQSNEERAKELAAVGKFRSFTYTVNTQGSRALSEPIEEFFDRVGDANGALFVSFSPMPTMNWYYVTYKFHKKTDPQKFAATLDKQHWILQAFLN